MQLRRIVFSVFFIIFGAAHAQEWSRFRGPNGSGIGKIGKLPVEISSVDYEWAVKLAGFGHSSPVLWGNRIFITATDSENINGTNRSVHCFDSTSGKKLWTWSDPLQSHNLHKFNNFASATPTVDRQRVYMVWGSGDKTQAVALSHTGGLVWRQEWPGFSSDHGHGASPILVDGVLVFHTDSKNDGVSRVIGLEPETGEVLWKLDRNTPTDQKKHLTAYNTPVTMKSKEGGQTIVTLQSNDGWKGLNPLDGTVLWSAPGGYKYRSVGSVVSSDGHLFACFGSGGGGKHAVALKVESQAAKELYSLGMKDSLSYVPTPIVYQGLIFMWGDGGILTCRDIKTGTLKFRERIGGNFFSSPVLGDGKLMAASKSGDLIMVEASSEFRLLGRSKLESGVHATPAIANGCLIIRTDSHLISICGK